MNERMFANAARERLLAWYAAGHRELPWRHTRDPYCIMVSEIMLQQTQAERVIPKYHAFLERFPTLQALADAPASEVLRAWSGLGYNRRALNLQRACRVVVAEYGGAMPRTVEELARLPGIGPYTAGAIACFAWGADAAFMDTNIRRVLQRVVAGPEMVDARVSDKALACIARASVPPGDGYAWNQALMELGATVCKARAVACPQCPLERHCRARPTIQGLLAGAPPRRRAAGVRFEETSRYYRGRVVAALGEATAGLSLQQLGELLRPGFSAQDASWLLGLVEGLERDGLVVPAQSSALREEAERYDGGVDLSHVYQLPE
jgi:A/G-specific adenine glycosylase